MGAIYTITCTVTNTTYVGSTANVRVRWGNHRSKLQRGKHENEHLQRAWNKYGADTFDWAVIEQLTEAKLVEREQYWPDRG